MGNNHAVAKLLKAAADDLRRTTADTFRATPSLIAVVSLANTLQSLVVASPKGIERRLSVLWRDSEGFEANVHELEIAAHYVDRGMTVQFVPSGVGASHDFTVKAEATFHVECKRVNPRPPQLVTHETVSRLLGNDLTGTCKRLKIDEAFVEIHVDRFLQHSDHKPLQAALRSFLALGDAEVPGPRGTRLVRTLTASQPKPYATVHGTARLLGTQAMTRRLVVQMPGLPNRTANALDLVRAAADQLPGGEPGIVFLSATGMTQAGLGGSLSAFKAKVARLLEARPHVSACVVTVTEQRKLGAVVERANRSFTVHNPKATFPATASMLPPEKLG